MLCATAHQIRTAHWIIAFFGLDLLLYETDTNWHWHTLFAASHLTGLSKTVFSYSSHAGFLILKLTRNCCYEIIMVISFASMCDGSLYSSSTKWLWFHLKRRQRFWNPQMETPSFSFLEEGTPIIVYTDVTHILLERKVWFKGHVQDQSMP